MKKFISWRRVSTQKQGMSGLGLEAQKDIIDYFVAREKGELIADYCEVYTGTELSGCAELRKAMDHCKKEDAVLVIAKTDRFRNTIEALKVYDEMGDGHIFFCDLPTSDKFTLTLFFALAEREAMLISIRTQAALNAKKERGEATGGRKELWGKNTYATEEERDAARELSARKAGEANGRNRTAQAKANPLNIAFWHFMEDWQEMHGKVNKDTDWDAVAVKANSRGMKTPTGLDFNKFRAMSMYTKVKRLYAV